MICTDSFRVSRGPHGPVWWRPGETIPDRYCEGIRTATEAEVHLMRRIVRGGRSAESLEKKLGAIMESTLV